MSQYLNNSYKYLLISLSLFVIIFYLFFTDNKQNLTIESYIYKNIVDTEDDKAISDFYHYEKYIKKDCIKNEIPYRIYEIENNKFIGHKITYNNKIYFYYGIMTDMDFVEKIYHITDKKIILDEFLIKNITSKNLSDIKNKK